MEIVNITIVVFDPHTPQQASTAVKVIYLPVTLNVISQMTCWLTDQQGKALDLRGEEVTITFHIKAC